MRVAVVAEEAAGARALRLVLAAGHELVLAVTTDGAPTAHAAQAAGVPVAAPGIVRQPEFAEQLRRARVDLLLNVHSLLIVRPDALAVPTLGCFNLHPGPLPRYAGLDTPSWAIAEGAATFGCTVHWMDPQIDAGPVAYAASFDVAERETGLSLNARCVREGLLLLSALLEDAERGRDAIPAVAQQASGRRYYRRGPPNGGVVDWAGSGAAVDRFVRACDFHPLPSPWAPGPRTWAGGRELRILQAHTTVEPATAAPGTVVRVDEGSALVAAADLLVEVQTVAVDGRSVAAGTAFSHGMVLQPGP